MKLNMTTNTFNFYCALVIGLLSLSIFLTYMLITKTPSLIPLQIYITILFLAFLGQILKVYEKIALKYNYTFKEG